MSRPKSKRASQNFFLHPKQLPSPTRVLLLQLLGYSEETLAAAETPGYKVLERKPGAPLQVQKGAVQHRISSDPYLAIYEVQTAIAMATEGAEHLDNPPRAADYRDEFTKMRKAVLPVIQRLASWTEYYRDQFVLHGQDVHQVEQTLNTLYGICGDVVASMKGQASKGAPKQNALIQAIRQLRHTFRKHYCGAPGDSKRMENRFVRQSLEAGRAISPEYDGLNKLLRDPRCDIDEPSPDGWRSS